MTSPVARSMPRAKAEVEPSRSVWLMMWTLMLSGAELKRRIGCVVDDDQLVDRARLADDARELGGQVPLSLPRGHDDADVHESSPG